MSARGLVAPRPLQDLPTCAVPLYTASVWAMQTADALKQGVAAGREPHSAPVARLAPERAALLQDLRDAELKFAERRVDERQAAVVALMRRMPPYLRALAEQRPRTREGDAGGGGRVDLFYWSSEAPCDDWALEAALMAHNLGALYMRRGHALQLPDVQHIEREATTRSRYTQVAKAKRACYAKAAACFAGAAAPERWLAEVGAPTPEESPVNDAPTGEDALILGNAPDLLKPERHDEYGGALEADDARAGWPAEGRAAVNGLYAAAARAYAQSMLALQVQALPIEHGGSAEEAGGASEAETAGAGLDGGELDEGEGDHCFVAAQASLLAGRAWQAVSERLEAMGACSKRRDAAAALEGTDALPLATHVVLQSLAGERLAGQQHVLWARLHQLPPERGGRAHEHPVGASLALLQRSERDFAKAQERFNALIGADGRSSEGPVTQRFRHWVQRLRAEREAGSELRQLAQTRWQENDSEEAAAEQLGIAERLGRARRVAQRRAIAEAREWLTTVEAAVGALAAQEREHNAQVAQEVVPAWPELRMAALKGARDGEDEEDRAEVEEMRDNMAVSVPALAALVGESAAAGQPDAQPGAPAPPPSAASTGSQAEPRAVAAAPPPLEPQLEAHAAALRAKLDDAKRLPYPGAKSMARRLYDFHLQAVAFVGQTLDALPSLAQHEQRLAQRSLGIAQNTYNQEILPFCRRFWPEAYYR
jgi:hypothetical protein